MVYVGRGVYMYRKKKNQNLYKMLGFEMKYLATVLYGNLELNNIDYL